MVRACEHYNMRWLELGMALSLVSTCKECSLVARILLSQGIDQAGKDFSPQLTGSIIEGTNTHKMRCEYSIERMLQY